MRIGVVSYWFNRGQGTVGRHLRSALEALGHKTFVLARPTKKNFAKPAFVSRSDVWNQPGVTVASNFNIPDREYLDFVRVHDLQVLFCDQNYQFDALAKLRALGLAIVGRFVWEAFRHDHVLPAQKAYSAVYSLTRCEQARYKQMGIDSAYVRWGLHPELLSQRRKVQKRATRFLYIGGYLSDRKPTTTTLRAFETVADDTLRLVFKTQRPISADDVSDPGAERERGPMLSDLRSDPRITVVDNDLDTQAYYDLFASCDVSLAPSRWEGLGLHLFEALALGLPTISCDIPPINEVIRHGIDGLLVPVRIVGTAPSGIPACEPDRAALRNAIARMARPGVTEKLAANTEEALEHRAWSKTLRDLADLVATVS